MNWLSILSNDTDSNVQQLQIEVDPAKKDSASREREVFLDLPEFVDLRPQHNMKISIESNSLKKITKTPATKSTTHTKI